MIVATFKPTAVMTPAFRPSLIVRASTRACAGPGDSMIAALAARYAIKVVFSNIIPDSWIKMGFSNMESATPSDRHEPRSRIARITTYFDQKAKESRREHHALYTS